MRRKSNKSDLNILLMLIFLTPLGALLPLITCYPLSLIGIDCEFFVTLSKIMMYVTGICYIVIILGYTLDY